VTDSELVRRAQQGDVGAIEHLIRRYEGKVFEIAFRLMGNQADAADAAQEALVKVYRRIARFRGEARFTTWLHRLVIRTCLDEIRRRKKHQHDSLELISPSEPGRLHAHLLNLDDLPEQALGRRELAATLHQVIGGLREDYRVLVLLRDLEGFTYEEITAITGWTYGAVKAKLHRARLALRATLESYAPFAGERERTHGQQRYA